MRTAAAGLRGVLLRGGGGFELAAQLDGRFAGISSDAVTNEFAHRGATQADTSRVRVLLEGSRSFAFGAHALTPRLGLGLIAAVSDVESAGTRSRMTTAPPPSSAEAPAGQALESAPGRGVAARRFPSRRRQPSQPSPPRGTCENTSLSVGS